LSVAYLLLNAASYTTRNFAHRPREWRPCAGQVLGFTSIGIVFTKIMTFFQNAVRRPQVGRCANGQ